MKKQRKATKQRGGMASVPDEERRPIFGEKVSDIVPGEVLLQLDQSSAASISESISRRARPGVPGVGPSTFGISAVDSALAKLKVTAITRLHPPAPAVSPAMEHAVPMAATFRVNFDKSESVEAAVKELNGVQGVQFAEPNRYRETCVIPNDPSFALQWGLTRIHCPAAWDRTIGSANVVVAVIDTGIDLDHPELAPLLVGGTDMVDLGANPTPPPDFRFEGDFQGRDNIPQDEVGHGTHVAGTIACLSNNNSGVAGVTWSCRLMPVRVLARIVQIANPADVRGVGSAADISAGIRWAVDNGARVLNLSLGGPVDTQVERDAIAYAIAHGVAVVAAMGNGGFGAGASFPAAYPDVVAVGAIDQSDHRAGFSQIGPHIDIAAPGVGVLSTVWDNGFATMSGTSMATPHVAGVAALVLSCNPNLTGPQVADILRQTAQPLRDNPADPVPNDDYGFGCVDAQAALNRACPIRPSVLIITCRRSTIIRCPSVPIVTCPRPSVTIGCHSVPIITCQQSTIIRCPSVPIVTCPQPSVTIRCPSVPIVTCPQPSVPIVTCPQPSVTIRCPTGPICGGPGPIEQPLEPGLGEEGNWGYDPYGGAVEGWGPYDPYAWYYGEEGRGC
jgi:Subtilase family/N-terminal of Subtilase family